VNTGLSHKLMHMLMLEICFWMKNSFLTYTLGFNEVHMNLKNEVEAARTTTLRIIGLG